MGDTQYESEALRYAPWHRRLESFSTTPISHQICPMVSCGWLSLICNAKYRHMPLVVIASVCRFLCPVMPYRVRQKHANVLLGAQFDQSGSCLELKKKSDQLVRGVDIFFRDQDWDESHRLGRLPERRPLVSGRVFDGVCTVSVPD